MKNMLALAASAVAIIALAVTAYFAFAPLGDAQDQYAECRASTVVSGSTALGGDFDLISETGTAVGPGDVFEGPTLVYFGFTYCPDVCPLDSGRTAEALDLLSAQGKDVKYAFVSIDPERDTPEVLAEYTSYFHDNMFGLTGTLDNVAAAAKAYRVYYAKNAREGDTEDYLMDHSTYTYLVDGSGEVLDLYRRSTTPEEMASSVACYVGQS